MQYFKLLFLALFICSLLNAEENKKKYIPQSEPIEIAGIQVYLSEEGQIDQFWFADVLRNKGVPKGIQMIDLRDPKLYKMGHIPTAINIPWDRENDRVDYTKFPKNKLIVFYCTTGVKSTGARIFIKDKPIGKRVLYFDANVHCEKDECFFEPHENIED